MDNDNLGVGNVHFLFEKVLLGMVGTKLGSDFVLTARIGVTKPLEDSIGLIRSRLGGGGKIVSTHWVIGLQVLDKMRHSFELL